MEQADLDLADLRQLGPDLCINQVEPTRAGLELDLTLGPDGLDDAASGSRERYRVRPACDCSPIARPAALLG